MTDVSEWAKREAERRYPASWEDRGRTDRDDERDAFWEGAEALAALLLSDEAVEAAAVEFRDYWETFGQDGPDETAPRTWARAALEVALTKITEEKE